MSTGEPIDAHDDYRCEDRSLALRWLSAPVFMPIVRVLPRRLTPNQITLCGHVSVWVAGAVALGVSGPQPLVLVALAFGYTAFNITDIVDGMYARHSGQTSRLGELLDHGLDPLSVGLVPLTYGIAMREPAWLILASTAAVAYLQFLTFLHGYRVGQVILGEVGVIEGLGVAAAACLVGALGGLPFLTRVVFFDVSWAGLVAIAFMAATPTALPSMRGLLRRPADLIPLALLLAAILVWHAFGATGVRVSGLLMLCTSAYEMMRVTSARLRRLTLSLWDLPFTAALAVAAGLSIALHAGAGIQAGLAIALSVYAFGRTAFLFVRTVEAFRR